MNGWKNTLLALLFLSIGGVATWTGIHYLSPSLFSFHQSPQLPSIPLSIGVVDITRIKYNSKVFQKFREVLENLNAKIHTEILDRETKLRGDIEQFKKHEEEAKEPTQEILKQKMEIDKKYAALEKAVRTRREERDKKYLNGINIIKHTLKDIMDDLGSALDLKIILNKSIGDVNEVDPSIEQSIVLFCNDGLDLTNEVIKRLDKKLASNNFGE